jgi:hypothetical protein
MEYGLRSTSHDLMQGTGLIFAGWTSSITPSPLRFHNGFEGSLISLSQPKSEPFVLANLPKRWISKYQWLRKAINLQDPFETNFSPARVSNKIDAGICVTIHSNDLPSLTHLAMLSGPASLPTALQTVSED